LQIQTTIQLQHPLQEPTTINTCIPLAKDLDNSTNASLPDSSGGGGGVPHPCGREHWGTT
jgi:hypothetical protein